MGNLMRIQTITDAATFVKTATILIAMIRIRS